MKIAKGSIAIMGSGETSPALVSVHRNFIELLDSQVNAYLIDTPFGFQENADVLVDKLKLFFKKSVQIDITLASLRNEKLIDSVEYFEMLEELGNSNFIFSGPGSPSYASKTWLKSEIPNIITNHLNNGKYAIFSSAAASTLGEKAIPVYEIYKVGMTPFWEEGLNILTLYGLNCTVVPHFNNKEGGNHDTSCSYIGKNRLKHLIDTEYTNILGIDEHTALVINGSKEVFTVEGIGQVTVMTQNGQTVFKSGQEYKLIDLQNILLKSENKNKVSISSSADNEDLNTLKKELAKLNLELKNNNNYTLLFDDTIRELIGLRNEYRNNEKYTESDDIRNLLDKLGIIIEDSKDGSNWKFKDQ
tara:strand:- start:10901 stop:11977 length:1077 start_codon:yes stop_codon:yes gene_type:complete